MARRARRRSSTSCEASTYNDVALNGIILISTVLDFAAGADTPGNELSYITNLPSMAAAALYHGKAERAVGRAVRRGSAALGDRPLCRGPAQGPEAAAPRSAPRSAASWRASPASAKPISSRPTCASRPDRFYKELLRDRGLTIGRLDARYTGKDYDNAGENSDNDPSFYGIDAGYTAAVNAWQRGALGFKTDREYQSIGGIGRDWDWRIGGRDANAYLNVTPYIGKALRENSAACGSSSARAITTSPRPSSPPNMRCPAPASRRTGSSIHYYHAGHMMYVRDEDRREAVPRRARVHPLPSAERAAVLQPALRCVVPRPMTIWLARSKLIGRPNR